MNGGSTTKKLVVLILRAAILNSHIRDRFFLKLIQEKIKLIIKNYVKWASEGSSKVAQYNNQKDLNHSLDSLVDILRIALRFHLAPDSPLLDTVKSCLDLKLETSKDPDPDEILIINEGESENYLEFKSPDLKKNLKTRKISSGSHKNAGRKSKAKEMIVKFVKNTERARVKDFVDGLKSISERTIKRSLSELVRDGFLVKKIDKNSVFYSVID